MIALNRADPRSTTAAVEQTGIVDLYRAVLTSAAAAARSRKLDLGAEVLLIGSYLLLRTMSATDQVLLVWLGFASLLALVSPTGGLVVLAAIAPLNEGVPLSRDVGSKTVLAIAVLGGIALRWPQGRTARLRPPVAVILAAALFVASGLGLAISWQRWGATFAESAAEIWLQGVGTMLIVFVATVWVARRGSLRPLVMAVAATTAAGLISLLDFSGDASIRDSPFGWLVVGQFNPDRLTGVIRSPTSTAALVMIPLAIFLVAAFRARDRRIQIVSGILAVPLLIASYLTYNRAVFLGLWLTAVVAAWRLRRWLGVAVLVGGIVLGVAFLPSYVALRAQAVGPISEPTPGQTLIASDQQRLTAWATAGKMFLDQPFLGQGYRAYRQLSVAFGDPTLNAPHNEWIRFFAEGGILTGVLAIAFALATILGLMQGPDWLETGLLASFLGFCVAASFNNPFLFNQVTIPAFIAAGTGVGLSLRGGSPTGVHG